MNHFDSKIPPPPSKVITANSRADSKWVPNDLFKKVGKFLVEKKFYAQKKTFLPTFYYVSVRVVEKVVKKSGNG